MNRISKKTGFTVVIATVLLLSSCKKEASNATGWTYNDPKNGGFEVYPFTEQITGPGLVFIEGGTFMMGQQEEDVMRDWNANPRTVTIPSFYMDECEVSNLNWHEYLSWLHKVFVNADLGVVYQNAMPDKNVWRDKLAYMETNVEYYFDYPAYRTYPVVGVSWLQAVNYAAWRGDRVNEKIMAENGFIEYNLEPGPESYFTTDAYYSYGNYEYTTDRQIQTIVDKTFRDVKMEDGIMLPHYRLPIEAEWEYAAYGLIGNTLNERILDRKIYPWNGHHVRVNDRKYMGDFAMNIRRGRGDYMGTAGHLNDESPFLADVHSYWPNDYGLYNMAGNVAEWVMDVYRQVSHDDVTEINPFRGNYYQEFKKLENGEIAERDSIGRIPMVPVSDFKNDRRRNYRQANNKNYLDGDWASSVDLDSWKNSDTIEGATDKMYRKNTQTYSLISDRARVYKGGSWKDLEYWAAPAHRRYLDEDEATDYIGFRCAMSRLGAQVNKK